MSEYARTYFWSFSAHMQREVIRVQHEIALIINVNHSRIRAMR